MKQLIISTKEINSLKGVRLFFKALNHASLAFHPEDSFTNYINLETKKPCFSEKEAIRLDGLMDKCFKICEPLGEGKIYDIAMEQFLKANEWFTKQVKENIPQKEK
ncbi:hypothetical protein VB796_07895 [Arcicella sp. LKC2W]|uniref:hypothetical protein n=1 Tax=Arcicella sp. LKC2W TaxID=2984198 RepID=UPI002B1F0BE9|nr:hypothetical protein [Arcicella sp. LKC2W]MEA5458954.1 hypothetical protein [Arcicella sp. LKC2W]